MATRLILAKCCLSITTPRNLQQHSLTLEAFRWFVSVLPRLGGVFGEGVDTPVVLKNAETLFLNIFKEENITYGYLYNVADKLWYATDTVQDNRFFVLDENFIDAHT